MAIESITSPLSPQEKHVSVGRRNDKRKLLRNRNQNIQEIFVKARIPFFFFACKANISEYNIDCTKNNYFNLLQIEVWLKGTVECLKF